MMAERHEHEDSWIRYTLAERRVTARTVHREVVEGQVREVCSATERLVGFISPHQDRWAAYVHCGYGYLGLGFFNTSEEALDAIVRRYKPEQAPRELHKAQAGSAIAA